MPDGSWAFASPGQELEELSIVCVEPGFPSAASRDVSYPSWTHTSCLARCVCGDGESKLLLCPQM